MTLGLDAHGSRRLSGGRMILLRLGLAVGMTLPGTGAAQRAGDRVSLRQIDAASATVHWVMDERLDLATRLARVQGDAAAPLVALPPRLVVGQGPDITNRSIIRVLNRYGICEAQFIAFDPSLRGGVVVAAGSDAGGSPLIAATPHDPRRSPIIRVFNPAGGLQSEIASPFGDDRPLLLQLGDFLADQPGDELAVVPRTSGPRTTPLVILSLAGATLLTTDLDLPPRQELTLSTVAGAGHAPRRIMVHARPDHELLTFDAHQRSADAATLVDLDRDARVYPSHFGPDQRVAVQDRPVRSLVQRLQANQAQPPTDVGLHENQFWISPGHWSPQEARRALCPRRAGLCSPADGPGQPLAHARRSVGPARHLAEDRSRHRRPLGAPSTPAQSATSAAVGTHHHPPDELGPGQPLGPAQRPRHRAATLSRAQPGEPAAGLRRIR